MVAKGSVLVQVAELFEGERLAVGIDQRVHAAREVHILHAGRDRQRAGGADSNSPNSWNWSQLEFCSYLMLAMLIEGYSVVRGGAPLASGHSWAGRWSS
jgi:hypothetical protein